MKKKLLTLCLLFISLAGYNQTTKGTEFWLNFFQNDGIDSMFVIVAAPIGAKVTIDMPANSFTTSITLVNNGLQKVYIPSKYEPSIRDTLLKNAIRVTSDKEVIVYGLSAAPESTDATCVIPASAQPLNATYLINPYNIWPRYITYLPNVFSVVPHDSNVMVEITTSSNTTSGWISDKSYIKTLHMGDVYIVRNKGPKGLAGSTVRVLSAGKKISVYQGNDAESIDCGAADHLFEVVPPSSVYGRNFILTPFYGATNGYLYYVMGTKDSNIIYRNGIPVDTLKLGEQFAEKINNDSSVCITTTKPSIVTQIMIGCNQLATGDPSIVYVVPTEQTITNSIISTSNTDFIKTHFVNVVLPKTGIDKFYLDRIKVPISRFNKVYCGDYFFYSDSISPGSHTVQCDDGFIAYVYGMGDYESYAYFAGASFRNLELSFDYEIIPTCDSGILAKFTPNPDTLQRYKWVFPSDAIVDSDTIKNPTVYFPNSGDFDVRLNGYSEELEWQSLPKKVNIRSVPKLKSFITNLENDSQCLSNNFYRYKSNVLNGQTPYTYLWQVEGQSVIGDSTFNYSYKTFGLKKIELITIDNYKCKDTTAYNIKVFEQAMVDFEPDSVCLKTEIVLNAVVDSGSAQILRYDWDLGDGTIGTVNPIKHTYQGKDTNYKVSVIVSVNNGCKDTSETKTVLIFDAPTAQFSLNALEPQKEFLPYQFKSNSLKANSLYWFIDNKVYTDENVIHNFRNVGDQTIELFIKSSEGCKDSISQVVIIAYPAKIYVPNSFSPNGDGINETFGPESLSVVKEYYFAIFNRWGEKIFETTNPHIKWNGKYQGIDVQQDNYMYMINLIFKNEERYKKGGQVLLLR